jgi:hypothetical protein
MPEPQAEPKKVRVFGPDNRYYQFPAGTTKEAAVSYFKKKGITSPESPAPKSEMAKVDPSKLLTDLKGATARLAPEERPGGLAKFGRGVEQAFGVDPEKMATAFKGKDVRGVGGQTRHVSGAEAQWAEMGEEIFGGLKNFGLSVLKDPLNAAQIIEGPARGIESGASKMIHGQPAEGAGEFFGSIGGILGGAEGVKKLHTHANIVDGTIKAASDIAKATGKDVGEAASTAHKLSTEGTPSRLLKRRAFEDQYVHAKGLDVAKKVTKAVQAVSEEVKLHASGIAEQIDTKIPTGVVDAGAEAATIMKEFQDVVKTPEKAHPVLVQMVKDAQATAPKLWSWEKARQFRSSVGRAMSGDKVVGPQKVVLTKVYIDLTKKLGGAAKQYGLEKSWNQYNELASKMDKEFSDITDDVGSAKSGQEVAAKLGKDTALTLEMSKNLSKYGLKASEISDFIKTSKRIQNAKNFMNRSIFRLVYGSAPGLATAMSLRMSGAPYIAALGGGALVGLTSTYLVSLARIMKLSPEVIEHMMKERELPGKMKFEPGTFPSEEAPPQLPEPSAKGPSEPITGEPESERLVRLGPDSREATPPTVEEIAAHKARTEKSGLEKVEEAKKRLAARSQGKDVTVSPESSKPQTSVPKSGVYPEGQHGTGKLAEQSKARERITKNRGTAKRTEQARATEAAARAQAQHMDVSQLQIPEMEEYLKTKNPKALSGLTKMRKGGIPDVEYIEALKYLILEDLEK